MSWYQKPEIRVAAEVAHHLVDFFATQNTPYRGQGYEQFIYSMEHNLKRGQFEAEWSLGGTANGWGGHSHTVGAEVETALDGLDEFLIEKYPTIGFLQYKMIERKIERTTDNKGDYYGGSVTYGRKSLSYTDLSDTLVKYKLASNEGPVVTDLSKLLREKYSPEWFSGVQDKLNEEHQQLLGIEQARRLNKAMKKTAKIQTQMKLPKKSEVDNQEIQPTEAGDTQSRKRKPK
jgi:hypothetical protein